MRLLYVTAQFPFGAVESFLEPEVRALMAQGVEVDVAPMRPKGRCRAGCDDIVVVPRRPPMRSVVDTFLAFLRQPREIGAILVVLASDRRHLLKNLLVLPNAVSMAQRVKAHKATHIHAHWLSTSATSAWIVSRLTGVPFSVTAHRWDIIDGNLLEVKGREAQFVRAISEDGRSDIARKAPQSRNLVVIPMGVPVADGSAIPSAHQRPSFHLLCPAFLLAVKGHRYLLEAMVSCPGVSLVLAGTGPEQSRLEKQARALGIDDRVRFAGQIDHEELLAALQAQVYDAVVLPSLHEGIPVSLMEAMVRGIPVITTTVGGIPELVTDGESGLLVAPGDSAALSAGILSLAEDPELCSKLASGGRAVVLSRFRADACADALMREIARPPHTAKGAKA